MPVESPAIHDLPPRMARDGLGLTNQYTAPESEAERRLAEIWGEALNFDRIGVDDDFFALGGDSLAAVAIAAAVSKAFDLDFKPSQIMDCNTVRRMATTIGSPHRPDLPANVVLARASDSGTPLFLIHGQYGITFLPPQFMSGFRGDQPIYIFQVPGYDGTDEPYDTVEEIAADYLSTMLAIHKSGPYFLAAFCAGSWIAIEMANQMKQRGLAPDRLILMDPALSSAMDEEFLVNRGRMSGGSVPVLSPLAAWAKLAGLDLSRRTKFLMRTGRWVNGQDHASFALPAVRRFWVERQQQRLDASVLESVASSTAQGESASADADADTQATTSKSGPGDSMLEAAAYASAKLQLAFRTYRPATFEGSADLIVSEKTARILQNPAHPINRVVPTRRLTVFGATHAEAVAGSDSRNARLIQKIIDEVSAVPTESAA